MDVDDDILVTVATVINPEMRSDDGHYMEVISYNHQYNSRHDPNQPIKGKVRDGLEYVSNTSFFVT